MDIREYLKLIRENWVIVLVATMIAVGGAGTASALATPQYQAHTQLFVSVRGSDSVTDLTQGNSFSERRVSSYMGLAKSSRVIDPVIKELELSFSAEKLKSEIKVSSPAQTVLIDLFITDPSPAQAQKIANALGESLIGEIDGIEGSASGANLVKISVVEAASLPTEPVSPNLKKNLLLGGVVGLLVGILLGLLRGFVDTRLRSREAILAHADHSVLGTIAEDTDIDKSPLGILRDPHGMRAESFRQLRTSLQFTNLDDTAQSIVVTSCLPSEGKSSTAMNLALMIAEGGSKVLLIDADLRRPRVADYLGLESSVGLTTVLAGRVSIQEATQAVGATNKLDVLTSGRIPPNPSELLGSERMIRLLRDVEENYDVVILDAPPLIPVTDPSILASIATGTLVVTSVNGRLRKEQLLEGLDKLSTVDAKVLGMVLNRVPVKVSSYSSYNYQPLAETKRRDRKKSKTKFPRVGRRSSSKSIR